jgi:hypothetical protein
MRRLAFFCAFSAATGVVAGEIAPQPVIINPIILDGKPIDQGGAWARIVGLRKGGDGFVSVRAAPSVDAAELDRLTMERRVYAFNPVDDWKKATFIGVVYSDEREIPENFEKKCGLPDTLPAKPPFRRVYAGPCKSGWVHKRFVEVLAD